MTYREKREERRALTTRLMKESPAELSAFGAFVKAVESNTALDEKTRALILVALALKSQCDWCIATHVERAVAAGARREEILAAGWLAVQMGGGPTYMHLTLLLSYVDAALSSSESSASPPQ